MGSNLGFTPIRVEFPRSDPKVAGTYRSIYYVRYIDWFITTPLLLLDLLLTAGMSWPTLLWVIIIDEIMVSVQHVLCNREEKLTGKQDCHWSRWRSCTKPLQVALLRFWMFRSLLHRLPACVGGSKAR
jgi:bacteriorhodopsin